MPSGFVTPGGGSQPVKIVRVPLAFNTPDLAAVDGASMGVVAYTPTPGDCIVWSLSYFSVPLVGFDVGDPSGQVDLHLSFSDLDGAFFGESLTGTPPIGETDPADGDTGGVMTRPLLNTSSTWLFTAGPSIFRDATSLRVIFSDAASGDPGLIAGEGELVLYVVAAS